MFGPGGKFAVPFIIFFFGVASFELITLPAVLDGTAAVGLLVFNIASPF